VLIFYLHGFRSTPRSKKALQLADYIKQREPALEFFCPALPVSPANAVALIECLMAERSGQEICLVGSSLGGFYATYLAERYGVRAVLLNPAITPQRDLKNYLGEQTVYGSDQAIFVKQEFLAELESLNVASISRPERYFLLAATGDELIDWRDMTAKYQGAKQHVIKGSDHGLSDFAEYIQLVLDFAKQP
jgi:predicted esterase YcpF (UPF0227 family)